MCYLLAGELQDHYRLLVYPRNSIAQDYEEDEECMLGRCTHGFHSECFKSWLKEHGTCPCVTLHLVTHLSNGSSSFSLQCLSPRPRLRINLGRSLLYDHATTRLFVSLYAYICLISL